MIHSSLGSDALRHALLTKLSLVDLFLGLETFSGSLGVVATDTQTGVNPGAYRSSQ